MHNTSTSTSATTGDAAYLPANAQSASGWIPLSTYTENHKRQPDVFNQ
jgi:hypothetical protein